MPYKDPQKRREMGRKYCKDWRARHDEYNEVRKSYPSYARFYARPSDQAAAAYTAVQRALKSGRLVRPRECSNCGSAARMIEAAHTDYARQLDVRWLCRPCHRSEDAHSPKGAKTTAPRKRAGRGPVTAAETRARRTAWARMNRRRKRGLPPDAPLLSGYWGHYSRSL